MSEPRLICNMCGAVPEVAHRTISGKNPDGHLCCRTYIKDGQTAQQAWDKFERQFVANEEELELTEGPDKPQP